MSLKHKERKNLYTLLIGIIPLNDLYRDTVTIHRVSSHKIIEGFLHITKENGDIEMFAIDNIRRIKTIGIGSNK